MENLLRSSLTKMKAKAKQTKQETIFGFCLKPKASSIIGERLHILKQFQLIKLNSQML